jgi:hypothetical protein
VSLHLLPRQPSSPPLLVVLVVLHLSMALRRLALLAVMAAMVMMAVVAVVVAVAHLREVLLLNQLSSMQLVRKPRCSMVICKLVTDTYRTGLLQLQSDWHKAQLLVCPVPAGQRTFTTTRAT